MKKFIIIAAVITGLLVFFYFRPAFRGDIPVGADFHIGFVKIHWYGLLMALGIFAGYGTALRLAFRFGFQAKVIDEIFFWIVVSGFLGARIYYVLFSWSYFQHHLFEILAFWRGGMSIYGAIIAGALAGLALAWKKNLPFFRLLDLGFLVLPLGQAIGRFGNFFNQEAFGRPTNLPWGLYIPPVLRPLEYIDQKYFHPAFLYESLWDLAIFFILLYLYRGKPRPGFIAGCYLVLYPLGRFFIEELRLDSFFVSGLRVDQIVSLAVMVVGALILNVVQRRNVLENN